MISFLVHQISIGQRLDRSDNGKIDQIYQRLIAPGFRKSNAIQRAKNPVAFQLHVMKSIKCLSGEADCT